MGNPPVLECSTSANRKALKTHHRRQAAARIPREFTSFVKIRREGSEEPRAEYAATARVLKETRVVFAVHGSGRGMFEAQRCASRRKLTQFASRTESEGNAVVFLSDASPFARHLTMLIVTVPATHAAVGAQSAPSGGAANVRRTVRLRHRYKGQSPPPPFTHLKPQTLQTPYQPLTRRERLRWFTANTMDPWNLAGGIFDAAFGTAPDRPKEYGPHWAGFGERYGIGMTRSATGNAIEAGAGLLLREDPRYFRVPYQPFQARVRNVVRFAFAARGGQGSLRPAYARYMATLGANFLSNSWRVNSEANAHDALLRSAEGFGEILAANAFEEFWPDVKTRLFHKRD